MGKLSFNSKLVAITSLTLLTSWAAVADSVNYEALKKSYEDTREQRLYRQYSDTFPSITEQPLWGVLNKTIAAIGTHRAVDEALLLNAINNHAASLKSLPVIGHDGNDLVWPLLTRIYYLGNNTNGIYRGAISVGLENRLREHYFYILSRNAVLVPYDVNSADVSDDAVGTWRWANDSENHIYSKQSSYLLMLQALHNDPSYRNSPLPNGYTVEASYQRWLKHWNLFLDERIKHGPILEVGAITYSKYTLSSIMNLIDFPEDLNLREKARNLADIIFATAATETLSNGIRAGSKSRKFTLTGVAKEPFGTFFAKLYLTPEDKSTGGNQLSPIFLTSSYFPASVVTNLWKNAAVDKAFELHARVPGVLFSGSRHVDPNQSVYHYTYMTPSFAMGSSNLNVSRESYAAASSESRVASVVMNDVSSYGTPYLSFSPGVGQCFDRALTAQNKNVMIVQNSIFFLERRS